MDGDLIKIIVVGVFLVLGWVSKSLEKKATRTQRGGPAGAPRSRGLDLLAELEKKLREAQRAAEAQSRGEATTGAETPAAPPPRRPAAPRPSVPEEAPPRRDRGDVGGGVERRHLDSHVGGLEARRLDDAVETRHLELDLTQAREGHAALLETQTVAGGGPAPVITHGPTFAPAAVLPRRLTELQRALVWSEILGPPSSLRDASDRVPRR